MARELLTTTHRLEENMALMQGEIKGHFQIGCSTTLGKYLIPQLVANFREHYPHVRIDVLVKGRQTIFDRLTRGDIAFGVSSKRIDHQSLEYVDFCKDEIVLIVPIDHPWARFGEIYCDDLLDMPIILREPSSGTNESLFAALREHDITPDMLNVKMIVGSSEAIAVAVEEKLGIAFVSQIVARRAESIGRIARITVQGLKPYHQIYFARNLNLLLTPSQNTFWEFFTASRKLTKNESARAQNDALPCTPTQG